MIDGNLYLSENGTGAYHRKRGMPYEDGDWFVVQGDAAELHRLVDRAGRRVLRVPLDPRDADEACVTKVETFNIPWPRFGR